MHRVIRGLIGWVEDHPWWTLGAVALITALFVGALLNWGLQFETDFKKFLPEDEPAVQRLNQAEATFGSQDLFLIALVADDTIFKPETLRKFKELEGKLAKIVGVDEVQGPATAYVIYGTKDSVVVERALKRVPQTPEEVEEYKRRVMGDRNIRGWLISEDGRAGAISVTLKPWADAPTVVDEIQKLVREYEGPEKIYLVGEPVLRSATAGSMIRDLRVLVPFVILVMVVVLLASFRSLRGVALPMLVVLVSTLWTVGSMALAGVPMTPFAVVMPVMLIAIGAADGIHILNKYYEAVAEHAERDEDARRVRRAIVLATMEEMAVPVILTSLTTAAGFLALLASFLWPQRQFGLFTALGILYAMVLSLTLIPALLARLPLPKSKQYERSRLAQLLGLWGRMISRKPALTLGISGVILVAFALGIPKLEVETRADEFLGREHPVVRAMYAIEQHFGGVYHLAIEIDTGRRDGLKDPEVLKKIAALEGFLESRPEIGRVASIADVVRQLNETLHASDPQYYKIPDDPRLAAQLFILYGGKPGQLFLGDFSKGEVIARRVNIGSTRMAQLVRDVQRYLDEHFNGPGEPKARLVGPTQAYVALLARIIRSQITSLSASFVTAGVIVALLMGSWVAGLLCLLPLILTILIEFGVMAYAGLPLDMATIMLGSIAIGVGIDYSIHFLHRFRREVQRGIEMPQAFHNAIRTSGRGIAYNAISLMLGFAVLLASSFHGLVTFGLLLVLTMLVSSLSSFTVIPAILLLREPAFLRRPSPFWEGPEPVAANPK
jgi:hypothetical protein